MLQSGLDPLVASLWTGDQTFCFIFISQDLLIQSGGEDLKDVGRLEERISTVNFES